MGLEMKTVMIGVLVVAVMVAGCDGGKKGEAVVKQPAKPATGSDSKAHNPAPTPDNSRPAPAPAGKEVRVGTLVGDVMAGGAETTGWLVSETDGGVASATDVDVSKVQKQAEDLKGQRVRVTGVMIEKDWPERGKTKVLVAEKIEKE